MPVEREAVLQRLRTAEGHLHAIRGMIETGVPCQQILHQLNAVQCAIEAAGSQMLRLEIECCLEAIREDICPEQRREAVERLSDLQVCKARRRQTRDVGTVLLIVIGAVLLIALIALLGGGMAMGGMAMMAGMMATPVGWLILLILVGMIALVGYVLLFQGNQQASAQVLSLLSLIS